jgi:hypothetical protein
MSFFDSEVVQSEMKEISDLQEKVYHNIFKFQSMDKEEKIDHVNLLQSLLEKQKILYTRLSLSDDSDAAYMKQKIIESTMTMGLPENIDMNIIFSNMNNLIENMKVQIKSEEE